jgi:subtilase family serine protease
MKSFAVKPTQHFASTLLTFMLVVAALAQAEPRTLLTSHVPDAVSSGVAPLIGHVAPDQHLSLAISLPLRNEAGLDDLVQQIYDRQNPNYHRYLSVQEFTRQFGPVQTDYAAVLQFANAHGLSVVETAPNRMVLDVEGRSADIESAFHVAMNLYQHPTENRTFYAPDREPTVDLDVPLLHVSGLDNFSLPHPKNIQPSQSMHVDGTTKTTGSGPGGYFVGSDTRAAYYGSGPLNGSGQSVGLFEFAGYEVSDVQRYFKKLHQSLYVPIKGVSLNGVSLSCPPATCDDGEQALDIEMSISMAPGLDQVVVYVGGYPASIFNRMATDNTSKQLSCSWGWTDNENILDPIFKEMAVQGQSVFVATGDDGSASPAGYVWPADDPYVTAVGGTDLITDGPGGPWKSETGWSGSAGMPSKNGVPIPPYQMLKGVVTPLNHASSTLRNIPDVSAEANTNQWICADGGCSGGWGGTSFAAPQWAGILAMANEQAFSYGKPTLGFLNPVLYEIGVGPDYVTDFHDILKGNNGKYSAVKGYDLVTGWGSPVAADLIDTLTGTD